MSCRTAQTQKPTFFSPNDTDSATESSMIPRPCLANARPCGHAMSTGRAVKATFGPSTLVMSDAPLHKLLSPANLSRTVERPNEKQELKCNKGRSPQSPSRSTRLDWCQSRVLVESHPFARGFEITQDLAPSARSKTARCGL